MIDIEIILQNLLDYYDLDTLSQLADKLDVTQPTISKWKSRGSIAPIKKKCKDLGIYDDIFKEKKKTHCFGFDTSLMDIKLNLRAECQKYGIQITTLKNKRLLYLLEHIAIEAEVNKQTEELENDLIDLFFKYYPLLNKDLFPIKNVLDSFEKES